MPYTEGAHDSPADTKDRLVRVGSKYQASPPSVADGDNVYLLVGPDGSLLISGTVAHNAVDSGNPVKIGFHVTNNLSGESAVAVSDRVDGMASPYGAQIVVPFVNNVGNPGDAKSNQSTAVFSDEGGGERDTVFSTYRFGYAPDGSWDRQRTAGDSGPGLGTMNVAPIGGDVTLRASAVAGEASGTSTALDDLGWIKGFNCHLDVTAAPSGGAPTLDVYLQTQLASGDWQDVAHFTQATGVTAEIVDYGPPAGNFSGLGAEGAAVTYDRFFAEQDGALAATNIRLMNLGDSMRVKWVFAAGGSSGDFTFAVTMTPHS